MLFSHHISIAAIDVQGYAEEASKKFAQQRAGQHFLQNLFPRGTTWTEMIEILQNEKEKLFDIVQGKYLKKGQNEGV